MMGPDVLIVGLGPAGAAAAEAAARAGVRVLAVDRRTEAGRPVQCAEFVPGMLDQELGALDTVTNQRIGRMETFLEDASGDATPDFKGRMIDRAAFDATLVARAVAAGAECRFGAPLRALDATGTATLADGTRLAPHIVVGADGPRSPCGRAIGSVNRELVETRQVRVRLLRPHDATDIFLSAEIPGGYAWLFPQGDEANLGIGANPAARARLKPLLDGLHARLADEGRVGRDVLGFTGGAIPVGGLVRLTGRLGEVPVLLAGDAGGLANPVTGAGIAAAVQTGRLAGRAATAWLAGAAAALDDYSEEVEEVFGPALVRALRRRRDLLARYAEGGPDRAALRRGWIAYPEYWAA
ncbi:MAG: NAD(P)/FAD-dependent oxidoreductase [Rhodospirillales bacterium]|nr:NAD(P)/FAD-dependent oxidoreductase [Rhodospirillales bacterium]